MEMPRTVAVRLKRSRGNVLNAQCRVQAGIIRTDTNANSKDDQPVRGNIQNRSTGHSQCDEDDKDNGRPPCES
jgi:hypothetical protein